MSKFSRYLIALAVFAFCAASVFGQTVNTRVSGTVKDQADAVVPGVKITLIDTSTKEEKTVNTNDEGNFVFADVRAGTYMVTAERANFKKLQVQNVRVAVDIPAVLSMTLEAGGVAETVSVTASDTQSLIRTEDAKLSTTIDMKQVQDLPLNGRNPINLAGGMSGVSTNTNVRQSVINGLRGSFSNITWDGIEINDNLVRTDSLFGVNTPSVAGVAEFTLTTQNAGPDEGLGIAQVKLTTPRGGKSYHGSVYDFYRNSKFDANTFFNNNTISSTTHLSLPKPALLQHQYGFTVGGPFALPRLGEGGPHFTQKHKLFFYFFHEKTNTTQDFTPLRTVLSAGARTGSFTYLRVDNGQPQTVNLLTLTGRSIDPRIQTLINLTPPSNNNLAGDTRNTQGFSFNTPNGSTGKNDGFRIDYDVTPRNRVEAIYSRFVSVLPNDVQLNNIGEQFPGLPGGGQASVRPRASFAWHSSPTSNITNEARFGYASNTPTFINREKFDVGYQLSVPLITNPIQNFLQQGRVPTNYDTIDNVTWVKGNHVLKFGGIFRAVRILNFNDGGTVPSFTVGFNTTKNQNPMSNTTASFPGGMSSTEFTNASSLLALMTGAVSQVSQTFNVADKTNGFTRGVGSRRHFNYNTLSAYGGDTWRFRENLSLNIGLRWEYISPVTERDGLALLPKDTSLAALNDPNVVFDFAGGGTSRPFMGRDLKNFAPNFSFAWDPFKSGKTSVRGGFAISYAIDNNVTVVNNAIGNNAGLSSGVTVTDLAGTVSGGGIFTVPTPVFKVPRTLLDQSAFSQTPTIYTTQFNLKTPYAEQWNFGIEREVWKDTALSVGYVGNRGVGLTRAIDTNQVVIFQNGFFQDFLRAQANLALTGNPACITAGCQTLTIFPKLGAVSGSAGNLANSTIRTLIQQGQVGELAATYTQARCTYFIQNPGWGCPTANGVSAATGLGTSFFQPANPNAFVTDYVGSSGWSSYHGLQAEIRKRLTHGWYYQVNYTWSKAFTNAEQAQSELAPYLDNTIGDPLEKRRNSQDVTHVFNANAVYELPFGPGKMFLNKGGVVGKLLGGWQISGLAQIRSGRPITFTAGAGSTASPFRGTVNRSARSGNNTPNTTLTLPGLQALTGLYFSPTTGLPIMFDPKLIGTDGRAALAFFTNPTAGTFGNLSLTPVNGPGYWDVDTALIKRINFKENLNLELRLETFNVFNHTNFSVSNSLDINSTSFGKITATFDPRIVQLSFKFNF
jgi:Carboxypeptidase regulatory-like domain/TonB dependent receptor